MTGVLGPLLSDFCQGLFLQDRLVTRTQSLPSPGQPRWACDTKGCPAGPAPQLAAREAVWLCIWKPSLHPGLLAPQPPSGAVPREPNC